MHNHADRFVLRGRGSLAAFVLYLAILPIASVLRAQTAVSVPCPVLQTVASFQAGDYFVVSSYLGEDTSENNPGEGLTVITAYDNGTVVRNDVSPLIPGTPEYSTDPPVVAAANGTIKACYAGLDGDESPTVTYTLLSTIASVKIAPADLTVAVSGTQQFSAIGVFDDGSSLDVTGQASWTSSTPGVATVTAAGKAIGVAPGTTTITSSLGPASGVANLTVATAAPMQLSLSCAPSGGPVTTGISYTAICAASGGVAPYSWSLGSGSLPIGLSLGATTNSSITIGGLPSVAGSYSYTVLVSDASTPSRSASQSYSGTIGSPHLSISAPSLTFSAPLGVASRAQQITVTSNPAGMMYTAAAAPGCLWLNLSGATGTTNETLSLSANGLLVSSPGTYNCEVTVSPAGGGEAQNIYVSFIVTGVNLNTNPPTLSFTYASDGSQPAPQSFAVVSDSGAAIPFGADAGCSWVSVSPAGGSAPGNISVTVSPANMAPGEYRCPVGISAAAAANRPELAVKLQVTSPPVAAPSQLLLTAVRGARVPTARTIGISGPGTPSSFTARASADNGGGWLSLDTLSGATPANLTVLANPSNLASGSYHGDITITFVDGKTPPLLVDVMFVVSDLTMTAVPSALTFRYPQGGTPPPPQVISMIASDGSAAKFTAAASGPGMEEIRVTSGPGTQSITIAPSAVLAAGTYTNASVTITSAIAPTQQTVPVTIIVDPPALQSPVLSLSAPGLTFSFTQGGAAGTQMLTVGNAGGGTLNITTSRSTNSGGDWLSANCTQVPIANSSPGLCTVTADPAKVIPDVMGSVAGTYSGQVAITTDVLGQYATVPVIMTLTPLPLIVLSNNGLTFSALESGIAPPAGTIEISNSGPGTLNWMAEATTVIPGGAWLKLGASSGTANSTTPVSLQVTVDPTMLQAGLPPGSPAGLYYGSVLISATDAATGQPAANSPRIVTIVMTVGSFNGSGGSHLSPSVTPSSLLFSAAAGTANVPAQAVTIYTAGTSLAYSLVAVADDGGSWCSASPATGTVNNSGTISVQVDFTNSNMLSGSTHTCDLRVLFADGSLQDIMVTALVTSTVCDSGKWLVSVNRPQQGSTVPAYLPASWEISVTDSCTGQPITAINSLSLFFSNGDALQQLTNRSSSTGIYTGSWTPTHVPANQARATVGIQAIADGGRSAVVTVDVAQQVKNVPQITALVNSASYTPAWLVAPCSWVSIFGRNLAEGIVRLARAPLILQYVSDGQINAQIPCGLQTDAPQDIVVDQAGAQSVSQSLIYASTAPAIFTADQSGYGQAAVLWTTPSGDHVLADQNHPAPAGTVVEIYATGLGLTNPAVKEGTQAPSPAATAIQPVGVSIENTPAQVQFAGLSPGAVGLYQVNAVIPDGISAGNSVSITINSGNSFSRPGSTIAVK
jgi:uncharacterized protein (TIGR03437 family)